MAFVGFSHAGTPAASQGSGIRATMAANLSANWTVHPLVAKGSGTTLRAYWVVEHSNGPQILFYVADGSGADGSNGIYINGRSTAAASIAQDLTIWCGISPTSGLGSGSGSFYDSLNVAGNDPGAAGFWTAVKRYCRMSRCLEWVEAGGSSTIYFVEDNVNCQLIVTTTSSYSGRTTSISANVMSENLLVATDRHIADRLEETIGQISVTCTANSQENKIDYTEMSFFLGTNDLVADNVVVQDFHRSCLDGNKDTAEPDADGQIATQEIVLSSEDGLVRGVVDPALARYAPNAAAENGKRQGTTFMMGPRGFVTAWDNALGDII
jgi:hypothetical protein